MERKGRGIARIGAVTGAALSCSLDSSLDSDPPLARNKAIPPETFDNGLEASGRSRVSFERHTGLTGRRTQSAELEKEGGKLGLFDGQLLGP